MPPAASLSHWWSPLIDAVREKADYYDLLIQLTRRDIRLRYRQTVMGFGWAILMPLSNMLVFTIVFTSVVPLQTDLPYPLYAYAGLLAWNFFAASLRFGANSLTANSTLITKVYFPREVFPLSAVLVALFDSAVASTLLIGLMVYYQTPLAWTILLLPAVLVVHVMLTLGLALLLAMGNLFYRDVKYLIEILLPLAMFATSAVYPVDRVGGVLGRVLMFNPMSHVIEAYRSVLLRGEPPPWGPFLATAAAALLVVSLSWAAFHRAQFAFAEHI